MAGRAADETSRPGAIPVTEVDLKGGAIAVDGCD